MQRTLSFLLYDWLDVLGLTARERFAEHSRETFNAVLDTSERIARERFAPFNRLVDLEEPRVDGERVHLPEATGKALRAFVDAGLMAGSQDAEHGGMQLPCVVEMAALSHFHKASVAIGGYAMLTMGNANTLLAHGSPAQIRAFALPQLAGRFFGTMCLSEPQAGSSLSDIDTRALPDGAAHDDDPLGPRYRLRGHKMWISGGEHELSDNIVHLVLAKIPGPDGKLVPGVKGISLFVVPRKLVGLDGELTGQHNDVALAGLNHKCGYRGTVNTLLNFGDGVHPVGAPGGLDGQGAGAIAYRVGEAGRGLRYMFHMMNEARIGVGLGATMLGMAGFEASLAYARQRPQGRRMGPAGKDPGQAPVPIIEHADVRRMLLAQKAYAEGALALALYCARLVDEQKTGAADAAAQAGLLLEMLTPIAKSWPSQWCLEANSLAIQVLGGYGYTRDFPVEQYWRDNRLNMIHEGTHGIQALDLLGRKVVMDEGRGLRLLCAQMRSTVQEACAVHSLKEQSLRLEAAVQALEQATQAAWRSGQPEQALDNAVAYLQAFGHTVLGWIWLALAVRASQMTSSATTTDTDFLQGKLAAARYFHRHELPLVHAWLEVVSRGDDTCRQLDPAWF